MPADNTLKKCREVSKKYLKVSRSILKSKIGTSLVVQWSILHASNAGGTCSIPSHGTKIPPAAWCGQTTTKKKLFKKKQDSGYFRHRAGGVQDVAHGWGC